jgi:regulator of RNase E activity RraA
VQDEPVVTGSVTVYPEDIVSSDENSDGWWKLVSPDKKAQSHFKVCVHMKLFLRDAERDPGSAEECKANSRALLRAAEQVAGSAEGCRSD